MSSVEWELWPRLRMENIRPLHYTAQCASIIVGILFLSS